MKAMFWGEGGKLEEDETKEEDNPENQHTQKDNQKEESEQKKEEPEKSTIRKGVDAVKGFALGVYSAIFGKKQ